MSCARYVFPCPLPPENHAGQGGGELGIQCIRWRASMRDTHTLFLKLNKILDFFGAICKKVNTPPGQDQRAIRR